MPKKKSDRPAWRPRHWLNWFAWVEGPTPSVKPDPDRFELLEILIQAKGNIHPYRLTDTVSLGHKLKDILDYAKATVAHRKRALIKIHGLSYANLTHEEIRLQALELIKKHIVMSSLSLAEHRQWDAAERIVAQMQKKCDRESERLDEFIKSRTKSATLNKK
jgi:hypothetical protein